MKTPHIALTVDFSEESLRAFEPTAALATEMGAHVTLVHVVPDLLLVPLAELGVPPQSAKSWADQLERARQRLEEARARLPADLDVTLEVLSGESIDRALADFAAEKGVDYICMATHGRTGLRRVALGSICEAVLRRANVPVICFPRPH